MLKKILIGLFILIACFAFAYWYAFIREISISNQSFVNFCIYNNGKSVQVFDSGQQSARYISSIDGDVNGDTFVIDVKTTSIYKPFVSLGEYETFVVNITPSIKYFEVVGVKIPVSRFEKCIVPN